MASDARFSFWGTGVRPAIRVKISVWDTSGNVYSIPRAAAAAKAAVTESGLTAAEDENENAQQVAENETIETAAENDTREAAAEDNTRETAAENDTRETAAENDTRETAAENDTEEAEVSPPPAQSSEVPESKES